MSKGNSNRGNPALSPKELELYNRARREKKALSFAQRFPAIVELPPRNSPHYAKQQRDWGNDSGGNKRTLVTLDPIDLENWTLLDPISDLLHMVEALDLYAARCSDELSRSEHCREDCTHELESRSQGAEDPLDDQRVLAIGKKLQLISEDRRDIKNRFERVKLIKRAFESKAGQDTLQFLSVLLADEHRLRAEQGCRVYTPRTDILDDLYGYPLPKYVPPASAEPQYDESADEDAFLNEGDEEQCPPELLELLLTDVPEYSAVEPFVDDLVGQLEEN